MSLDYVLLLRASMKMQPQNSGSRGFRLRSIMLHSLWTTVVGIVLFRLATANTQKVLYVKIFAISGAVVATAPWIIQLLVSTTIILLYNAHVCDLTWLVKSPHEEGSGRQDSRAMDADVEAGVWTGNGIVHRALNGTGKRYLVGLDRRIQHQLHRSRTV